MKKEKTKAILFDVDGVLIDSEPLHFVAHKKALSHYGIELSLDDYMEFGVAKGDINLYEKAAEKYGVIIDKNEISKIKKKNYREIFEKDGMLMDGVLEILNYLKDKYELAIVSSGARDIVEHIVEKFNLKKYFKEIITGDDVERVKPFPDIYLKAVEKMNYAQEECFAIEDSQTGVAAAKNANIECIVIPNDFTKTQDFSRADVVISRITELKEIL